MALTQHSEPFPHWAFTDASSAELLQVVPERGGLVSGWRSLGHDWLYFDAERFTDPSCSVRGGIPVLFPICGGLPGDAVRLPQGLVQLSQHGFARDRPWQLAERADGQGVSLSLEHDATTLEVFPFRFRLELDYRLAPGLLEITARVENLGNEPMPFSLGLHPYWAVTSLADVRLEGLPQQGFDHLTMAEAPTAAALAGLEQGVDLLVRPDGPVSLVDGVTGCRVSLEPQAPWDLAVIWSDPPRQMLCLEPWTGPRQALISGDRLLQVPPADGLSLQCRYVVALS